MKAAVAYEAPRRRSSKAATKLLKWHRAGGGVASKGAKGDYHILPQKPDRRHGIFKWGLEFSQTPGSGFHPALLNGQPISCDLLSDVKEAAAVYDAMPQGVPIAIVASEHASGETCATCGRAASESPTREEWEVIVTNPPPAHRGAILAMGMGETTEVGNKIILRGFHDDEQAGRTASSIARTYKVQVTFGPRNALYEAAEAPHGLLPAQYNYDEHVATELELYADNTAELYKQKEAIIANLQKKMAKGTYKPELAMKLWLLWVDAAAKRYTREFPGNKWYVAFPPEVRREVARREEEKERAEMQLHRGGEANPLA